MTSLKKRSAYFSIMTAVLLGLGVSATEAAEPPAPSALSLWGGAASTTTRNQGVSYSGLLLVAGVALPIAPTDRQSIRFSISRLFDSSAIDRYNLLAHFGYRITERLGAGLLAWVEYITMGETSGTYLKPVIGAEMDYVFAATQKQTFSIFVAYESAQGSTGTIAFDGGTNAQAARMLSLGLAASIGIFQ